MLHIDFFNKKTNTGKTEQKRTQNKNRLNSCPVPTIGFHILPSADAQRSCGRGLGESVFIPPNTGSGPPDFAPPPYEKTVNFVLMYRAKCFHDDISL